MGNREKKGGGLKSIIIGILALLGVLFIILMLMPDDEDEEVEEAQVESGEEYASYEHSDENVMAPGGADGESVDLINIGTDAKDATIMIYMNGSDLESNAGEATTDLQEMIDSGIGKNVNVIVQTMGTKEWQDYDISSRTAQTYKVENGKLRLLRDNLGQLDCTSRDTLSEFIRYSKNNFPADRYLFLFWDHGGGPVYGFGYDEWQEEGESLTIAEMAGAFKENSDIHFDIIGMDCCIMASVETCYAFAPYCRYALLSEDFESGLGWSYKRWMREFEQNPGISAPLLGKYIVDDIITDNEEEFGGDSACMGLFNTAAVHSLFDAWKTYAYKNESALLGQNYSRMHKAKGRGFWDLWGFDESDVTLSDYYISDMLALIESVDNSSDEAKNLMSALKATVSYYGHTSDKNELTGLAVSLPYGDPDFYQQLRTVYKGIDLDDDYVDWLEGFVSSYGYDDYYDYGDFEGAWGGWGSYEEEYGCNISSGGSCQYAYDYDSEEYDCYEEDANDDWIYDYEEEIWYLYEGDTLYLYDDETNTMFYYDEEEDRIYYYDEDRDDWFEVED